MFIGKEDNVQNQNQVNNNSPYFPSIGMQLSKDASDLGLGNALHWDPEKNTQANQSYMSDDLSNHDIDDDEDSSFDWGDDIDNKCQKRDPTLRFARLARCYHKYCFWHYLSQFMKRVVIAVLGSLIFITIGVCVYIYFPTPTESEKADPRFANVRSNVQLWMYWLAFMWHIAWITTFVIEVIPYLVSKWIKVFRGRRSERFKSYMEVITCCSDYQISSEIP
jgi:hypothetical protein